MLGPDDVDQVRDAYGAGAGRLLAVKSRFDPDHVFTATPLPAPGRAAERPILAVARPGGAVHRVAAVPPTPRP
ncbi:BBE domain-containing protein [Streptomyces lasalocidi]